MKNEKNIFALQHVPCPKPRFRFSRQTPLRQLFPRRRKETRCDRLRSEIPPCRQPLFLAAATCRCESLPLPGKTRTGAGGISLCSYPVFSCFFKQDLKTICSELLCGTQRPATATHTFARELLSALPVRLLPPARYNTQAHLDGSLPHRLLPPARYNTAATLGTGSRQRLTMATHTSRGTLMDREALWPNTVH